MAQYDAIYLSPHLDDAALSCGGQIFDAAEAGHKVLVVTTMAGEPPPGDLSEFAQGLHARWELAAEVVARRREEDLAACKVLGAECLHWDFLDCIYRRHPQTEAFLYTTNAGLFGAIDGAETAVLDQLAAKLRTLPPGRRIFAPLAVGNHVDHQLVRAAAEASFGEDLYFYEDYPYVRLPGALDLVVPPGSKAWLQEVMPVSEAGARARMDAIGAFASQVSTFFNGRADLEAQIYAQISAAGGERVWQRSPSA